MTRLQLEPLGFVFLIFFMSILVIQVPSIYRRPWYDPGIQWGHNQFQFIAMLCHRFGTLAHIIASTELFCVKKTVGKLSEEELVVQNAVEIARELQAIRGVDESRDHDPMVRVCYSRGLNNRLNAMY